MRPGARYFASIRLLQRVKEIDPTMFTKSGIMVGLGEERNEVLQVMDDLRAADVDFLTIGQYLQPTRKHHEVVRFVPPDEFKAYETIAYAKGFLMVSASPLTRSSHHAGEDFARLQGRARSRARAERCRSSPTTRRVRHAAADMFDLVADVERYPEFVPLCRALKVRRRIQEPEGVEILVADMTVAYKLVRETFSSRVTLDRPNLQILVEYLDGPFSHLENRWTFHPVGEQVCDVEFFIAYEFTQPDARHADGRRCSTSPSAASRTPSSSAPTASIAGKRGLTYLGLEIGLRFSGPRMTALHPPLSQPASMPARRLAAAGAGAVRGHAVPVGAAAVRGAADVHQDGAAAARRRARPSGRWRWCSSRRRCSPATPMPIC